MRWTGASSNLRPWMPWTPDEPEALDTVYERLRGFRGRYVLGESSR